MPAWLASALEHEPEVLRVLTGGTEVELLVWGPYGAPGLFLLHGAGAHAHWWDGVAPLLAGGWRVAAMTLPGNARSGWRNRYASADFFADALACVDAASLALQGPPIFVGHSMGGAHLMHGAVHAPDAMRGLVLLDTSFRSPRAPSSASVPKRRLYISEEEAVDRFRLAPPGPAREPALVRHIARRALVRTSTAAGEAAWCWDADPAFWSKFEPGIEQGPYPEPLRPRVPVVDLVADESPVAMMARPSLGRNVLRLALPGCGHHAMLDRPLVLAAALRALLAVWPG